MVTVNLGGSCLGNPSESINPSLSLAVLTTSGGLNAASLGRTFSFSADGSGVTGLLLRSQAVSKSDGYEAQKPFPQEFSFRAFNLYRSTNCMHSVQRILHATLEYPSRTSVGIVARLPWHVAVR